MLQTQDLENALMYEEYDKAIKLAFKLRQPGKLLMVVNKVPNDLFDTCASSEWYAQPLCDMALETSASGSARLCSRRCKLQLASAIGEACGRI